MTDFQLLTLSMSVIIPLSFLIYSNSRINEAKETLRAELQAMRADMRTDNQELRAEAQGMRADSRADNQDLRNRLDRIEDTMTRLLADMDRRLAKLEAR